MDKIVLENLKFYGYHGVYEEERTLGQRFIVHITIFTDLQKAGRTDDLEHTVNYAQVVERVRSIVEGRRFKLIETLAETIAADLLDAYTKINEITVTVKKPDPPVDCSFDGVSVQIHRNRK